MTPLELADACEKAAGPDRELDYSIHEAIHGDWLRAHAYHREDGDDGWWSDTPPVRGANAIAAPAAYTASIDAAMTLVPEGCLMMVRHLWDGDQRCGHAVINRYAANGEEPDGKMWIEDHTSVAATPALALCAASLRAIDNGEQKDG